MSSHWYVIPPMRDMRAEFGLELSRQANQLGMAGILWRKSGSY